MKRKGGGLERLFQASHHVNTSSVWCNFGEDFLIDTYNRTKPAWDLNPIEGDDNGTTWTRFAFCRAVHGVVYTPKHFENFWYNQTNYHASCFWDDDRWIGFQMERLGIEMRKLRKLNPKLGALSPQNQNQNPAASTTRGKTDGILKSSPRQRRRLGSLTAMNLQLSSDITCPTEWISRHPHAFPLSQVESIIAENK